MRDSFLQLEISQSLVKIGLVDYHLRLDGFSQAYNVLLPGQWRNKGGNQMMVPVQNRACPSGLEDKEISSFRNLTWLYIPYVLVEKAGLSGVRRQLDMEYVRPGPHLLLSFNASRYSMFQQNNRIPVETE